MDSTFVDSVSAVARQVVMAEVRGFVGTVIGASVLVTGAAHVATGIVKENLSMVVLGLLLAIIGVSTLILFN